MDGYVVMPVKKPKPKSVVVKKSKTGTVFLDIHGGPHKRPGLNPASFLAPLHKLPYVNFNFPGSTGNGKKYEYWIRGKWSSTPPILYQAAKELGFEKFIACGGSFGAYAAVKFLELYPKETSYVFAQFGAYDRVEQQKINHKDRDRAVRLDGGWHKDPEGLIHLKKESVDLKKLPGDVPVILMYGLKDSTCLPAQSENLANAIAENKGQVLSIALADEAHGFQNPDSKVPEFLLLDAIAHAAKGSSPTAEVLKILSAPSNTSLKEYGYSHATVVWYTLDLKKFNVGLKASKEK